MMWWLIVVDNYKGIGAKRLFSVLLLSLLCLAISPNISSADEPTELLQITSEDLTLKLIRKDSDYKLLVSPQGGLSGAKADLRLDAFTISEPNRLVVDIPNFSIQSPRRVAVSDNRVSALRLGKHPGLTRVVIDLKEQVLPVFNVQANAVDQVVEVQFGFGANSLATSSSQADSRALLGRTLPQQPVIVSDAALVEYLSLKPNELVLMVDELGKFDLVRTDSGHYVLSLYNAVFAADTLLEPLHNESADAEIRIIFPEQQQLTVRIAISVKDNTTLQARKTGQVLRISPVK